MSEPTFPFPTSDAAEDEAAPPSRRRTLLALGGLGVVALGVAGVLVLTGPDEPELALGLPTGTAAAAATPTPTASPSALVPATAQVRPGRDPFRAPGGGGGGGGSAVAPGDGELVEPVPAEAPVAPAPEGAGVVPVSGPAPEAGPGLGSGPVVDSGPVVGGDPGEESGSPAQTVTLVRVAGDQTAVLSVDGAVQSVRVGEDFGPGGALLLLSVQQGPADGQWTAVVQRGSGDPFDVVTGRPAPVA